MKRTKKPNTNKSQEQSILTLASALVSRAKLASSLGEQYGGDRNIYTALGYKTSISALDYYTKYLRQDIANAVINRPVKATWTGDMTIQEAGDDKETQLEKAWKQLDKDFKMKNIFTRADRLTCLGQYGILLLGLSDVKQKEDFQNPVEGRVLKLMYIKPYGESSAEILSYETNPNNERYGLPVLYGIEVSNADGGSQTIRVHHTRVLHIVESTLESDIFGIPVLQPIFNRLYDLEKLVGGSAEMFWRGARGGFQGKVDKDHMMTPKTKEDLKEQLEEYENDLRRILISKGVDLTALAQQIADPSKHFEIQIQMISAVTGIPKRILMGSERGELSSAQDANEWKAYVQARREEYAEQLIIRPFVDKMIELKILPKVTTEEGYSIDWDDLFALSDKDKAEIGKARAEALAKYAASPMAEDTIPPLAFIQLFLGFSDDDITLITEMRDAIKEEEPEVTPEEEEMMREQQRQQDQE